MWNKIMPNKQEQAVADGSIALQADQIKDVIINNGVQISDIIPICNQIFELNFPKLKEIASQAANNNVREFADSLRNTLNNDIEKIVLNKFSDPDVQFLLNDALENVARKGKNAHPEILIDLIKTRVLDEQPEFGELVTTQAIEIARKITNEHLHFILMLFLSESLLVNMEINKDFLKEEIIKDIYIKQHFESIEGNFICELKDLFENYGNVKRPQIEFLQSIGLIINHPNTFSYSVVERHFNHYNAFLSFKDKAQFEFYLKECSPTYYQLLTGYDSIFNERNYGLSTVGNQIAISYLKSNGRDAPAINKFIY